MTIADKARWPLAVALAAGAALTAPAAAQNSDHDWSGFFVGASLSHESLENTAQASSMLTIPIPLAVTGASEGDGLALGVMGGYRAQWNGLVVGAEASATAFDLQAERRDSTAALSVEPQSRLALRATLGAPVGPTLVYGAIGVERLDVEYNYRLGQSIPFGVEEELNGTHYALGVAVPVGGFEGRLEYTVSDYDQARFQAQWLTARQDTEMSGFRLSLVKPFGR